MLRKTLCVPLRLSNFTQTNETPDISFYRCLLFGEKKEILQPDRDSKKVRTRLRSLDFSSSLN